MAVIQTNLKCELNEAVKVQYLNGVLFSQDNQANQINVAVYKNGEPASIAGDVTANVIRSDGGTVAVSGGTISENVASISLPSAAYYIPGVISIIIKITDDSVITTIAAVVVNVYRSSTDSAVDPGTIIPSIQTLISSIETAVASIPADYSSLWTTLAPAFDSSTAYTAGQYTTYNGGVYRFTTDHAGSWNASHAVAVTIGKEIFEVKNAFVNDIEQITGNIPLIFQNGQYRVYSDNTVSDLSVPVTSTTTSQRMVCAKCACQQGDVFTIKAQGKASSAGAYGFFDSDFKGIARGGTNTLFSNTVTAPENAAWFAVNNDVVDNPTDYYAYKGKSINTLAFKKARLLNNADDLNNIIETGWYYWLASSIPAHSPQGYGGFVLVYSTSETKVLQLGYCAGGIQTAAFRHKTTSGWDAEWTFSATTGNVEDVSDSFFAAINFMKSNVYYLAEIVQGTLTSSGAVSSSSTRLRSEFIPIESLAEATCDSPGWLNSYCYTQSKTFIGRITDKKQKIVASDILAVYSDTKLVRFLFGVNDDPSITPSDASTYHLKVYANKDDFYKPGYKAPDLVLLQEAMTNNALTENFSYKWSIDPEDNQDYIITMRAKYGATNESGVPFIRMYGYSKADGTQFYTGPSYNIASSTEFVEQSWRLPNAFSINAYQLNLVVPSGSTLEIEDFSICHDKGIRHINDGIIFHAHRGYDALFPGGSYDAVVAAAKLGFQSCIVIPKITADGVPICFHDDNSISGQMTQENGDPIPSEYNIPIQQLTYDQLMQWSIGYSKNPVYAGAKILKMDDFLYICAKTGMRPIFSVHPSQSEENWGVFKGLLDKYGLTKRFSVKSGDYQNTWKPVIDVFGDGNIYSIINLYGTSADYNIINWINTGKTVAGITSTRVDAEFFLQTLEAGTTLAATQLSQLQAAINSGIKCSCVLEANTNSNVMKKYIDMGVTEFTNGRHCSIGLNW